MRPIVIRPGPVRTSHLLWVTTRYCFVIQWRSPGGITEMLALSSAVVVLLVAGATTIHAATKISKTDFGKTKDGVAVQIFTLTNASATARPNPVPAPVIQKLCPRKDSQRSAGNPRSEERRVGKEGRGRGSRKDRA